MMRLHGIEKICVLSTAIIAIGMAGCDRDDAAPTQPTMERRTIVLMEGDLSQTPSLDVAPKNKISQGDRIVSSKVLLDESGQQKVGSAYIDCAGAGETKVVAVCSGLIDLEDGTLSFSEGFDPSADEEHIAAITGGTGAYEGATGSLVAGVGGTKRYEFELFLPN